MEEGILSVGIDIGTSTTQVIFSRLVIENTSSFGSIPNIKIVDKQVAYKSSIYFTPFKSEDEIDGPKIRDILEEGYKEFGVSPSDIKTGAVIITGEAAGKSNSSQILQSISNLAGDFVVSTAGPDLESIIAGRGSGAEYISKKDGKTVANLDIGGGTTNIAVFKCGEVIDTGCLNIGGRLIKINSDKRITYMSPEIKSMSKDMGIDVYEGMDFCKDKVQKIVETMVYTLEEAVGIRKESNLLKKLTLNHGLKLNYDIDYIVFSGGVADYIYDKDYDDLLRYGDIGIILGQSIKRSNLNKKIQVIKPYETIGATVVGAGSHTTEISGSTINYSKDIFPLKNIPILRIPDEGFNKGLSQAIDERLKWFLLETRIQQVALSIKGLKNPSFTQVQEIAKSIIEGMDESLKQGIPLVVIVENDMAKVLGQTMLNQLKNKIDVDVVCIDNISVKNGDFIDIGSPLLNGGVVPVVIKTLIFSQCEQ